MRSVQRVRDGPIVTGTKDMLEQTRQFYVDLYTDEGIEDEAQETMLSKITSFFCLRMWRKKMELSWSPETPHPWETQHMPSPHQKMRESRYFKPQPHPTMWLGGAGCRRPSNP